MHNSQLYQELECVNRSFSASYKRTKLMCFCSPCKSHIPQKSRPRWRINMCLFQCCGSPCQIRSPWLDSILGGAGLIPWTAGTRPNFLIPLPSQFGTRYTTLLQWQQYSGEFQSSWGISFSIIWFDARKEACDICLDVTASSYKRPASLRLCFTLNCIQYRIALTSKHLQSILGIVFRRTGANFAPQSIQDLTFV